MPNLIPPADRSHLFTTAAEMARQYRQRAEQAFDDGDVTVWELMTDAADRYAAMDPATPIPLF